MQCLFISILFILSYNQFRSCQISDESGGWKAIISHLTLCLQTLNRLLIKRELI